MMKTRSFTEISFSVRMCLRMIFSTHWQLSGRKEPREQVQNTIDRIMAEYACALVELGCESYVVQTNQQVLRVAREITLIFNQYYPEVELTNNRMANSKLPFNEQQACMEVTLASVADKVAYKVFRLLKDFYELGIIPGRQERAQWSNQIPPGQQGPSPEQLFNPN